MTGLTAFVVAGSLVLAATSPARGDSPVNAADGVGCGFASARDPAFLDSELMVAEVNGGPLSARAAGATIEMACTIQVGAANSMHSGADTCMRRSATSIQVVVLPPTVCGAFGSPYVVPEGQPVYICTQITVNGAQYYWHVESPPHTGYWSVSSASRCAEAISQQVFPGPAGPAYDALYPTLSSFFGALDPVYDALVPLTVILCPIVGC